MTADGKDHAIDVAWKPAEAGVQPTTYWVRVGDRVESTSDTHLTVSGLRNGQPYEVVVFAATEDGRSEGSDPVTATPANGNEGEVAGLIVAFAPGVEDAVGTQDVPGEAKTNVDMQVTAQVSDSSVLVQLAEPVSAAEATVIAHQMETDPKVAWAEPDQFLYASSVTVPDTSGDAGQWNLSGKYGVDAPLDATAGAGATVAVIDTGITSHPALDGKTVAGYDFVSSPEQLMASRQANAPPVAFDGDYVDAGRFGDIGRDSNPADPGDWREVAPTRASSWHGTQIAGVISSIVPAARIQPIRALSWRGGLLSDIAASITWASGGTVDGVPANATPAKVINMSFSTEVICPTALQDAIDKARERGSILIAAAGNAGDDAAKYAPGNCGGVITVGATGSDGSRASYSNYGARVDVSAPGGSSAASVPTVTNGGTLEQGDPGQGSGYGTSIAAAHVSAAAALLAGKNSELAPDDAFALLTGKSYVKDFAAKTCDVVHPEYGCGAGILSLAQIATACAPGSTTYNSGSTLYRVLTFSTPGQCDWAMPADAVSLDALIIGGGGGGGGGIGGGGGAGRMVRKNGITANVGYVHSITVGAVGTGGNNSHGGDGGASILSGWSAPGGGGGGYTNETGRAGGSGGGGSCGSPAQVVGGAAQNGTPTGGEGYGNDGGSGALGSGAGCVAGGGGGAGTAGTAGNLGTQSAGRGGDGRADDITGTSVVYAGGGGGGLNGASGSSSGSSASGGTGGGGNGGGPYPTLQIGWPASAPGSGGGGASNDPSGGAGAAGVVIVRYAISFSGTVEVYSGNNQSNPINVDLASPLKVQIKGSDTLPLANALVTFAVASGGGHIYNVSGSYQSLTETTDSQGIATLPFWHLGTIAGTQTVTATYQGRSATFSATATPGAAARIVVDTAPVAGASGDYMTTQPVLHWTDQYGNAVAHGGQVDLSVVPASGSLGRNSGFTYPAATGNAQGTVAFTGLRFKGLVGTSYTIRASTTGVSPVWTVDIPGITVTGPGTATAAQSTLAASPTSLVADNSTDSTLTVTARDELGNTVPNQQIFYAVTSGAASLGSSSATTNASGVAQTTARSATAGAVTIRAYLGASSAGTLITTPAALTFTPGLAAKFVITGSSSQVAGASQALTITARDAQGNTATAYTGDHLLTFTGAGTAPGGQVPSVSDKNGASVLFGTATTITFANGVAVVSGGSNGVMTLQAAETANIVASEGSVTTSGSDRLTVVVSSGALSAFAVTDASGAAIGPQVVGTPFDIMVRAVDAYGNTVPSFVGSVTLTSTSSVVSGGGPSANFTAGVLTGHSMTLGTPGSATTITATRATGGSETGTSDPFVLSPEPVIAGNAGAWRPSLDASPIPAALISGDTTLAVTEAGSDVPVALVRNSTDSGWSGTGERFRFSVRTRDAQGSPIPMSTSGVLRVPVGGSVDFEATGYEASSRVNVFVLPRTTARSSGVSAYLTSGDVDLLGHVELVGRIPASIEPGDYILQIDGYASGSDVRSLNVALEVIPATAQQSVTVSRGSKVLRAFYRGRSDHFSSAGITRLRALVKSVPVGARNVTVRITGASVGLGTDAGNGALAAKRAKHIKDYLTAKGVQAVFVTKLQTSVRKDGSSSTASRAGSKPLTTVRIQYSLPATGS